MAQHCPRCSYDCGNEFDDIADFIIVESRLGLVTSIAMDYTLPDANARAAAQMHSAFMYISHQLQQLRGHYHLARVWGRLTLHIMQMLAHLEGIDTVLALVFNHCYTSVSYVHERCAQEMYMYEEDCPYSNVGSYSENSSKPCYEPP